MARALTTIGGLLLGLVLAVFFVFRTLFTDGPSDLFHAEYLVAHAINLVAYAVAVGLFVRFAYAPSWWWPVWIGVPAALVCALYMDPGLALRGLTFLGVALGIAAGWFVGRLWRSKSRD